MGGKLLNICLRNLLTPRQKCVSTTKSTLSDLVTLKWLEPLIITTIASIIITPRVTPFTPDRWVITLFHPIHLHRVIFDTLVSQPSPEEEHDGEEEQGTELD